jgi:integrase/recombinase XerD
MKTLKKTPTACSPLRQRMIEDMTGRNLVPDTQRGHIFACKLFAAFLKRSPETATADDIRDFQRHLVDSGRNAHYRNRIMTGVKFLLKVTMRRHDLAAEVYHVREPQTVAVVLAPEEVARVLSHAPGLRARAMLTVAYGCGLRGSEVTRLKVADIDAARHIIRVVESKGKKDRNVMLPDDVHGLLRQWWRERPTQHDVGCDPTQRWIFPGRGPDRPLTRRQFLRDLKEAASAAGITKTVTLHTLRHSCATHMHEDGVDIRVIQVVLGHSSVATTARYTRVSTDVIANLESPLDRLPTLSAPEVPGGKQRRRHEKLKAKPARRKKAA